MKDDTKIAGLQKVIDWKNLKLDLLASTSADKLEEAFTNFLLQRITTRYFEPISAISEIQKKQGKGFSIVAIYCSLIEFFETLKKGYEYKSLKYYDINGQLVRSLTNADKNGNFYPLSNKEIFVQFLTENLPFSNVFDANVAQSFYLNVRCSILHQAETNSNWKIKEGTVKSPILESLSTETILYWQPLKSAFNEYLNINYKQELMNDAKIQQRFIFKWDKICGI